MNVRLYQIPLLVSLICAPFAVSAEEPIALEAATVVPSAIPTKPPAKKASLSLNKKTSLAENERGVQAVMHRNWAEAEVAFQRALANNTGNLTAVFNLAGVYLTVQKNDKAVALLEEYTSRYQKDPGLFVRLGDAYFSSKKLKPAIQAYEKAFAIAPNYEELASKLATLYGLNQDFKNAERMLEIASSQAPNDAQVLNNLGNIYILNGKADKAVDVAKQALQIKSSKENYLTLGTAYEAQKDYKSALIAFEKAIDLGENRAEISGKVEKLRKITS